MNKAIALICLALLPLFAKAQNEVMPISVSYLGNFGIQPGLKVGTSFELRNWESDKAKVKTIEKRLLLSPQLGYFVRPNVTNNLLINADLGYQWKRKEGKGYQIISIGSGLLRRSQILSLTVDLSSGSVNDVKREGTTYFLPTVNYETGQKINDRLLWYAKGSIGQLLFSSKESSLIVMTEFGLKFLISK